MDQQQRYSYLHALKIPIWVHKESAVAETSAVQIDAQTIQREEIINAPVSADTRQAQQPFTEPPRQHTGVSKISSMLENLNRKPSATNKSTSSQPVTDSNIVVTDSSQLDWDALRQTVAACRQCELADYRGQTVFGTGNPSASWMVIGEAPGADEDRQGEPFVGRAGLLLNNMLRAIDLPRQSVYIANILKCRPPNNRDPKPEEAAHCMGYLQRQIALVNPTIILVVGRIAAQNLLQSKTTLGQLRNKTHYLAGSEIPVIVTYHPAYLLRQPLEKRKAWEDLKRARNIANTASA